MFNLKLPIRLIMLLILTVIVNIFSTVTIEYNVISFQEYRNIEVDCGDLFSVLTINDINNVPDELKSEINFVEIDLRIPKKDKLIKFIKSKIDERN